MILALDLGTTTGYAIGGDGFPPRSGIMDFKGGRFEGGGMRFLRFQRQIKELVHKQDEVYFEEVRAHKATDAAHIYGGLMAILVAYCEYEEIPFLGIPVGTIKKHATGKGNSGKPEMIAAAREKGWRPEDDNEADALWLLDYVVECQRKGVNP